MTDLMVLSGNRKIGRQDLLELPVPSPTKTHVPIPHAEVVEALVETLGFRHLEVLEDEWDVETEEVFRFLDRLDLERCLLLRIDSKDHDLVLLRGDRGGKPFNVLLGVEFEVTAGYPEVKASVEDVDHLGGWSDAPGDEIVRYRNYPIYLNRLCKILIQWLGANKGDA